MFANLFEKKIEVAAVRLFIVSGMRSLVVSIFKCPAVFGSPGESLRDELHRHPPLATLTTKIGQEPGKKTSREARALLFLY